MSDQTPNEEKKIIVDEDWKSQVQAEKEVAQQETAQDTTAEPPAGVTEELPPPNLTFIAGTLYMQGLFSLGMIPGPNSEKPVVHFEQAKHTIDTLVVLQEKTEGNRTDEETKDIEQMLHELRMVYLQVEKTQSPGETK